MNRRHMTLLTAIVGLATTLAAATPADRERLIAQSDNGKVVYRMIACEAQMSAEDCHAAELRRLGRHMQRLWVDAAVKKYAIELTPAQETFVDRQVAAQESHVQKTAAHFQALYAAVVAIRRGDERDRVLSDLKQHDIAAAELDRELEHLPTLAEAERAAAKDQVADGRRAVRDYYARQYRLDALRELVRKRAVAETVSFAVAEEHFWSEIARDTHTRIVDPTYTMPDRKGILTQ